MQSSVCDGPMCQARYVGVPMNLSYCMCFEGDAASWHPAVTISACAVVLTSNVVLTSPEVRSLCISTYSKPTCALSCLTLPNPLNPSSKPFTSVPVPMCHHPAATCPPALQLGHLVSQAQGPAAQGTSPPTLTPPHSTRPKAARAVQQAQGQYQGDRVPAVHMR